MSTISYAVKQLTETLREERLTRGLSQRELAARAHLGQSRLARIEAGAADLRASTLMQLARALDLEVVLAPRRILPAVEAMTKSSQKQPEEFERRSVRGTPKRVLRYIQQHLAALEQMSTAGELTPELERARRAAQVLMDSVQQLPTFTLEALRRSAQWLGAARGGKRNAKSTVSKAATQLEELRQMLPKAAKLEQRPQPQRGAYSLEEDEIA